MSDILTAPYYQAIRIRKLRLPGASFPLQTALLPKHCIPPDADLLAELEDDDWYKDSGGPCLVLGEAVVGAEGGYHPRPSYNAAAAVQLTKLHRAPQRKAEEDQLKQQEKILGRARAEAERLKRARDAQEAAHAERIKRQQELSKGGPQGRIEALEAQVKELRELVNEQENGLDRMWDRLKALEANLGVTA